MNRIAIIGGGIAGTSCAHYLLQNTQKDSKHTICIDLFHQGPVIKVATHLRRLTEHLEQFDIEDRLPTDEPNIRYCQATVKQITRREDQKIFVEAISADGGKQQEYGPYDKLCLATGAHPYLPKSARQALKQCNCNAGFDKRIITLRDTDSVCKLADLLTNTSRRLQSIAIVGSGGIAMELVFALRGVLDIHWIIKEGFIGSPYFDAEASAFLLQQSTSVECIDNNDLREVSSFDRTDNNIYPGSSSGSSATGPSVGPHWIRFFNVNQRQSSSTANQPRLILHYRSTLAALRLQPDGSTALLTVSPGGQQLTVGAVIFATGVRPNTQFIVESSSNIAETSVSQHRLKLSPKDGGLIVDQLMRTSVPGIFAAGDVCTVVETSSALANKSSVASSSTSSLWFQMRLWTQARQMGVQCAETIMWELQNDSSQQICQSAINTFAFELFAHTTVFFGYKVILLGRFNGKIGDGNGGCSDETGNEVLVRCTPGKEYVKVVLNPFGRMIGALLIGETDLEEAFENLILNRMDLSSIKDYLLDPEFDAEDYFD